MHPNQIRIGTLVPGDNNAANYIGQILSHGFECFQIAFSRTLGDVDLPRLAGEVAAALEGSGALISCLGVYGNPLKDDDEAAATRAGFEQLIDHAGAFGCEVIAGFAGRLPDQPIDASMDRFSEVFSPLAERAAEKGVKIAFENCQMGGDWQRGDWNIAHNPTAWEMMFNAVPADNLGLQWEPCHQMVQLIEPIPQLRKWAKKVFNIHGKDATIQWDRVREVGVYNRDWVVYHRTPGFGDSNWTDIISELRMAGYTGTIDIEGWHDPVYKDDWEMTGQVHALNYLKQCRGGEFVENPK